MNNLGNVAHISYLCLTHVCPCLQPSFLTDSAPGVCRELAKHLLAGVKILNPFINPESFRSDWIVWEPLDLDCSFAMSSDSTFIAIISEKLKH